MKLRYQVETPNASGGKSVAAKFARRSNAIAYALDFDNVIVRRNSDYADGRRVVFSRSTTKNGGFVTVTESETLRDHSK